MTPIQNQPIGQYPLATSALPGAGRAPAPSAATADEAFFSRSRPSIDGVQTGGCERRPLPNPSVASPTPPSPAGNQNPSPGPTTSGSTGDSFLDLISQLMNQLESVISGIAGGTNASQPDLGGSAIRRPSRTGQVA